MKVCLRVRPFQSREAGQVCCIAVPDNETLQIVTQRGEPERKPYTFDRVYWSHRVQDPNFASQETLMNEIGEELVQNALEGFNDTLFAYGQTSSGKTYTVIGGAPGDVAEEGLLPRMLRRIFQIIEAQKPDGPATEYQCTTSYLEIYNEKVHDLLLPKQGNQEPPKLEIRHHPTLGSYVPGLTESVATSYNDCEKSLNFGMQARSIAATSMNDRSSRSHCIFTFNLTQITNQFEGPPITLRSKLNLADLAGSERQKKTEASGARLKEAGAINQSLSHLAVLIHKLAEMADSNKKNQADFVQFRNSALTRLLQESLVGNSKTVMMVAISPAFSNLDETLGALRFAQSVKKIKTKPTKNESSNAQLVDQLKNEVQRLKAMLAGGATPEVLAQLKQREELAGTLGEKFEEKLLAQKELETKQKLMLEEHGLASSAPEHAPFVINVSMDPSLSGVLRYYLSEGEPVTIGTDPRCKLHLEGLGVLPFMCRIINVNNVDIEISRLDDNGNTVGADAGEATCGRVMLNGHALFAPRTLHNGDRLIIGQNSAFLVAIPAGIKGVEGSGDGASGQTENIARGDQLENMLTEVVPEDCEEYSHCVEYVQSLTNTVGDVRAQAWLQHFARIQPLVQEANAITMEVRPRDRIRLSIEVITDFMSFQTDEPELVVRIWKGLTGMKRWRHAVEKHLNATGKRKGGIGSLRNLVANLMSKGRSLQGTTDPEETVTAVWEVENFHKRLSIMREVYDVFRQEGSVDLSRPEMNPWREVVPWEWPYEYEKEDETTHMYPPSDIPFSSRPSVSGHSHSPPPGRRAESNTVQELREQLAARDARIQQLENQVAVFAGADKPGGGQKNAMDTTLKYLREESEASAVLAAKLARSMREIQQELQEQALLLEGDDILGPTIAGE